ncbi:hypothetical protein D3C87_16760 [compost metagenome]
MKNNSFKKWLVLSALFGLMCFSPHMLLRAQSTANYAFSTNTTGSLGLDMNGNVVDMSTGTTQVLATNTSQDQAINAAAITFPAAFEFYFGGNRFTSYYATSNGIVQLGAPAVIGGGTYTIAGGTLAAPRFSAFDGDLGTGTTGGIFGKLIGTGPNRCYVIEFRNMNLMWDTYTNDGTYQVRFYESTGVVEYVYGAMYCNTISETADETPEVGFSWGGAANQSLSIDITTSAIDLSGTITQNVVAPGANIPNLNSAAEGSRRIYRFTPPVPAAAAALTFTAVSGNGMTLNWTDNASNELAYLIHRSTDGVNYSFVASIAANSVLYNATGLSFGTLYYWKVTPVTEGALGLPSVSGNQATNAGVLSGIKTVGSGGDYQNLTTAFADINALGLTGNVELQLITGYPATPETYPIVSCNSIATAAYNVKVYPTVSGLSITSANATGTLNLNGATNLTFDGRVNQAGASDLVISNTNAGASYAVQFVNDAKSNTLQYLTIHSANNSTSSGTIVFAGSTGTTGNDNNLIDYCDIKDGATTPNNGIYSAGTSTTVDNSGNTVSNSNIYNYFNSANASNGIVLSSNSSAWTINANKFYQTGTRTVTAGSQHRGINIITGSGNGYVITNNVIGYASSTGTGVTTYTASAGRFFGIELTASNTGTASSVQGNTISGISLTSTSGTTTAPGIFAGISILGGTVSVGNVTPNTIGASTGTGAITVSNSNNANIFGIHANSSGTLNIVNNVISSISAAGSAAGVSCGVTGINTSGGGTALTITGNTIGSATANAVTSGTLGTTTATTAVAGISAGAFTTLTINGNTINNVKSNSSGTSSTLKGIYADASPTTLVMNTNTVSNLSMVAGVLTNIEAITPSTLTSNGNNVSNASVTGATGTIYGMRSSTTQFTYNNNVIHDLAITANSGTSSSVVYGIYNAGSPTLENITNNQIYNLSIAGATTATSNIVTGILTNTTASSVKNFSVNLINGLSFANSSTGTATVTGISSSLGATISIFKNKIYNLSSAGAGSTVNGIVTPSGSMVNIYNNLIGDLKAPTASAADAIRGISITSTSTSTTYRVYYNSVYLNASSTGTNFGTSGIYHAVNATATTAALDMRNNIIINESTPAGTGITVAFRRSNTALNNFAATSNRNLLYAGAPSATRLLMYDGTTSYQTMVAYQTAVLPREANSFTGEAAFTGTGYGTAGNFFISTTPSNADYLKPVVGASTQVESGAANTTTPVVADDYAAVVRQGNAGYTGTGTAPDLGAFEFEGTQVTPVITLNSVTPLTSTLCVATARLVSVNITTTSGTITGATIGYSVNGVPQTNIVMTNTSGSTWEGTIPVPTPGNAIIAWGVAAQNSLGLTASYTGTSYSDEPLTGVVVAATTSASPVCNGTPVTLAVNMTKSVTATIGTATTLTGATAQPTAFCNRWSSYRMQTIYTAAELTAAGLSAGSIHSMSFNISTLGDAAINANFTVKIGTTALTAFTDFVSTTGYTTVFPAATYTHAVGVNVINFSTPYIWDGTSNIVVEVSHDGANATNNAQTYYTATAANTVAWSTGGAATGTPSQNRLNVVFSANTAPVIQTISWSDGVATVGTTNPLTVSPTTTTTYTATITAAGCTVSPAPTVNVTVNPLPGTPTATNSAQCGVQIPTANVTSTSGLPTPTFNWYTVSTGGTAAQSGVSTTYTSTVASTTTFYVSELNTATGCESARVPVTVNVSTPDQVSLTPSVATICVGESFTLTAANINPTPFQSYTYSTECATTGSGAETPLAGASVTVTPTASGSFTYTLTGVDGGCAATATATVLVNSLPVISSATATPATVCSSDPITLTGSTAIASPGVTTIGTQSSTDMGSGVYRYGYGTGDFRHQLLFTAAELDAAGLQAGNITSIAFNVTTVGAGAGNNYTIKMGNTNATAVTTAFLTDPTSTVYTNAAYTAVNGVNTHTFSTPFNWNGTSNVLIEICYNVSTTGTSSTLAVSSPASTRNVSLLGTANACTNPTGSTYTVRPLITLGGEVGTNSNASMNWSWAPGTGLNTRVANTSISNTTGAPVTQVFTVTATNATTGCAATATTPAVTINPAPAAPVANNGTQCGTGVPTASVTGSGAPGNTYFWYLTATGGTALPGQTGSSLSTYSISATTTFYVSEGNGTCLSARTPVTATVTPPPAVTIGGTAVVCNGSSTALTASSPNDPNYTYTWSGGLGTGATVSASPTVNTTYTVTATDASGGANNGCVTSANISITVNPLPQSFPVVPATATICNGTVQNLTSGPATSSGTAILGTGTTAPSTTSYPNPFSAFYGGVKHQILFTAAELTAQGLVTGSQVNSITFDLNAFAANACANLTIRMGNTSNTALTGFVTGTSTVYGPTTYTPSATGLVTFTLTTPFTWNGTSNIVVETVHNAGNSGNGSGTRTNTTTTPTNTVYYGATDNVAGGIAGYDALSAWGTSGASALRPNVRFAYTNVVPTWSPAGTLYTNAGATTAYTGTATSSVYAKPTTTTTYIATYTGSNGCTVQSSATITVNQPSTSTTAITECDSYLWNGTTYTTSGTYTHTTTNSVGCDSVATLNLVIKNSTGSTVPVTACTSYTWPQTGLVYNTSGLYRDTVPNAVGCDSVITLNLTINLPSTATVTATGCGSYVWALNSQTYTTSGSYTHTIPNSVNCDSVVTLNLTIGQPNTGIDTQVACGSFTWINGVVYTASTNTPTFTVTNASGCDSVVTLNLTINQPTTSSVTVSSCGAYTWPLNGQTYTASGAYNDTLTNAANCDSIITLNLTVIPFSVSATDNGNGTFTASAGTSYQWINCTTNTPVAGATAQTFTPSVNGSYAVIITTGICSDTSNCITITNVGIKENSVSNISVHPNPTHDFVVVTMDEGTATVDVFDAQGKLVQTSQIKSGDQIDLGAYERGVYTLKIKTEVGTSVERIVKN